MRCPDCNKFVSFDTEAEPEVVSDDVDGTEVMVEVRRVLNCADCGTELKEYTFELSEDFSGQLNLEEEMEECGHEWNLKAVAESTMDDSKKGRIKYGVRVVCDIDCEKCNIDVHVELEDAVMSSSFEELT